MYIGEREKPHSSRDWCSKKERGKCNSYWSMTIWKTYPGTCWQVSILQSRQSSLILLSWNICLIFCPSGLWATLSQLCPLGCSSLSVRNDPACKREVFPILFPIHWKIAAPEAFISVSFTPSCMIFQHNSFNTMWIFLQSCSGSLYNPKSTGIILWRQWAV